MPIILPANSAVAGGFNVANSCRFNSGSSDSLTRTPSGTSNRKTFTYSSWVKRSKISSADQAIFNAHTDSQNQVDIYFNSSDIMQVTVRISNTAANLVTNRKFADVSSFYHIVLAVDTTQGTEANRMKLYVNGVQETSFSEAGYPGQNTDTAVNNTVEHRVGDSNLETFFNGYIAETVLIDGSALTPTSFGEFDEDSGIWKPINVSGLTFGTNGFYLDFEDSSALGNDKAGSNNFTVNNLTAVDQSIDTCTNNFATLNPLTFSEGTLSEGNLEIDHNGSAGKFCASTFEVSQGKWYFEAKLLNYSSSSRPGIGIAQSHNSFQGIIGANNNYALFLPESGAYESNGGNSVSGISVSPASNDIFMFAIDLDNLKFYAGKNNSWFSSQDPSAGSNGYTIALSDSYAIATGANDLSSSSARNNDWQFNFGSPMYSISSSNQDPNGYGNFEYSTEGFYAINSKNLAEFG